MHRSFSCPKIGVAICTDSATSQQFVRTKASMTSTGFCPHCVAGDECVNSMTLCAFSTYHGGCVPSSSVIELSGQTLSRQSDIHKRRECRPWHRSAHPTCLSARTARQVQARLGTTEPLGKSPARPTLPPPLTTTLILTPSAATLFHHISATQRRLPHLPRPRGTRPPAGQ